jgi:hypothetical protein
VGACLATWAVAAALAGAGAPARAQVDEMTRVYQQILREPGNVELNLTYARLAIERGELRKALAAYERVLEAEPGNAEAGAGLRRIQRQLSPDVTQVTFVAGAQGETNPRRERISTPKTQDGALFARIQLNDTRKLGSDFLLRTEGDLYANYHFTFHDIDYGTLNLRTGPFFLLNEDWALHTFVSGGYSWLKARSFYWETGAGVTLETRRMQNPSIAVTARFGYNFITESFTTRDALFFELTPRFTWRSVLDETGIVVLAPYWRYNGVVGSGPTTVGQTGELFPLRFHQIGFRADYFIEVFERVNIGVNVTVEYRHYYEREISTTKNRRDYWVAPGAQLIFGTPFEDDIPLDVIVSYGYERLFPSDELFRYENHTVGVRLLWRM